MTDNPTTIAAKMTEPQRTCGDVLDWLPCPRCGATTLKDCTVPIGEKTRATTAINMTPGLMNHLRAHLKDQS